MLFKAVYRVSGMLVFVLLSLTFLFALDYSHQCFLLCIPTIKKSRRLGIYLGSNVGVGKVGLTCPVQPTARFCVSLH